MRTSPSYHCYVALLIDEMHIKEDLVYNKHSGMLTGFVDLGEINNRLAQFEQSLNDADESEHDSTTVLAKSMVVMMVKGLFSSLTFAYAVQV